MTKLERPKGYSKNLWKKLMNQIRNVKRFVKEKTESGAKVKNIPDTEDVYTAKGRKKLREWSAKKQWEDTEYVDRKTNEVLTGKAARKQWMADRKAERDRDREPEPEPEDVEANYDEYYKILDWLETIKDDKLVKDSASGRMIWMHTGGYRAELISYLNDIAEQDEYLSRNEEKIQGAIEAFNEASESDDVITFYWQLLEIFNMGRLSKEQWDRVQDTAYA